MNSNDWALYNLNVSEEGTYEIVYAISTPINNTKIKLFVDDVTVGTDNVPNNGEWDNYLDLPSSHTVVLTEGEHTIKILASSSSAWQWNLDKITFKGIESTKSARINPETSKANTLKIYPNPATDCIQLTIPDTNQTYHLVQIISMNGKVVKQVQLPSNVSKTISISTLPSGIYLVKVDSATIQKLIVR